MTSILKKSLREQKKQTKQEVLQITGTLGIPLSGKKLVEVPNRKSFVFVKLRDNQSEVIQAFNNKVAASYGLPVIVERRNGRYTVMDVDTDRYQNNWTSFAPFLPRHGNTHSFDPATNGGGDIVWVHSRQFMPALVIPSGTAGANNVVMAGYTIRNLDGSWKFVGNTGTSNLLPYKASTGTQAVMALVYLDTVSGNPYLMVGSGSYFAATITGTAGVMPYVPSVTNPAHIPLAAVRLVSGTNAIGWNNIYDLRQFYSNTTGSGGGSGITNISGTSLGLANRVVGTNSVGNLNAINGLGWGVQGASNYIQFGINVTGQESNAGKMGYNMFQTGFLEIVGAGTSGGNRWVLVYDNLKVNSQLQTDSLQILGLNNSWVYLNGTGTAVGPLNSSEKGSAIAGTDHLLGINGITQASIRMKVSQLAVAIVTDEVMGAFLGGVQVPAATTYYGCPLKDTLNTAQNEFPWPSDGRMVTMTVRISTAQAAGGSLVVTLQQNNVDTALVVTIPASGGPGSYGASGNITWTSGDTIKWKVQNNAPGSASANMTAISMKMNKNSFTS